MADLHHELPRVAIFGAGCIGAFLAGSLLPRYHACSDRLLIIGRDKQSAIFSQHGLSASDYLSNKAQTKTDINFVASTALENESPADIVLVTIKCTAVEQAINDIQKVVGQDTIIVALQNGIGSEQPIVTAFPSNKVLTGVVGFNVIEQGPGHYHRGTEGEVLIENDSASSLHILAGLFKHQHVPCELTDTIKEVRWGKLLLNLNNALNALSDLPLKKQLETRAYRLILANCMAEALAVLNAAKITPAQLTKVSPKLVPFILKLPNWLFKRVANQMLAIDPLARSSMWYDITSSRQTEIDFINGAIVKLGQDLNVATPYNQAVCAAIKHAESNKNGSPQLTAEQISQYIKA